MSTIVAEPAVSAYRAFAVEVSRARRLSPSFLRMTFTGDDLDQFGTTGLDQRVKFVVPPGCGVRLDPADFVDDDWYTQWRAKPESERGNLRTYTIRAVRPELREVDVDVVLHGVGPVTTRGCGLAELLGCACQADGAGPAVRWCAAARNGDPIVLIGPDARWGGPAVGVEWRPPRDAQTYVLAGDETAVPAICAILEQLEPGTRAHAFLEVPTEHDLLDLDLPAGVEVHWLPRAAAGVPSAPHGRLLADAVERGMRRVLTGTPHPADAEDVDVDASILWDVPLEPAAPEGVYAWVAGEAGTVKGIRRHLVSDLGIDRRAVAFMGYWRTGRAEAA